MYGMRRILFVDDNDMVTTTLYELLSMQGYDVVPNTESENALQLFQRDPQRFDLVITDYDMPRMRGDDLVRALRRLRPDMPIIMCSGSHEGRDAAQDQTLGIDAFCPKPLGLHDLAETIEQVWSPDVEEAMSAGLGIGSDPV